MKKTLLAILGTLCSATLMLGFAACELPATTPPTSSSSAAVTYTLDSTAFDKVVAYKGAVNFGTLKLKGSDGKTVNVTQSMIKNADTNSVGNKRLNVEYEGVVYSVDYTVKYEVKFVADGVSLGTQYVLSADEIEIPNSYEMDEWEPAIPVAPQTINDNMTFVYKDGSSLPVGNMSVTLGGDVCSLYVAGEPTTFSVAVSPANANVRYEVTSSNDNVSGIYNAGVVIVNATKIGVSELTVKAINKSNPDDYAIARKTVVVMPVSKPIVVQAANTYGIEKTLTLGGVNADGTNSSYGLNLSLGDESKIGAGYRDHITWVSSNDAIATINNDGVITRGTQNGSEMVSFTAKFMVNGVEYAASQPYTLRYVSEGVNVSNYQELYAATKAQKAVVLNSDIAFPTNVADIKYETVMTTYDAGYYINKGTATTEATIKILLQFKNDLYGNGHVINAHNATAGLLDATGAPTDNSLFRGPLNFVAMGEANSGLISVKAQDNVCFALYEGVTANNVELRGCDLSTDENGNYDLTDLDYIGTTVEVFGDDVTIEYSRINNGRTVLRVFGDEKDATKVIRLNITNSVLSGAREFIVRMGSNCFVQGTAENTSPAIGVAANAHDTKKSYNTMTAAERKAYDEQYIKTFVTVKNSVFKDAGIFAIGIDSHFSGAALNDGSKFGGVLGSSAGLWKDLAKTSYGAKLTFEGDVRMYTWKNVEAIDSSTLIDNRLPDTNTWAGLTFDVKEMIKAVCEKSDGDLKKILTEWADGKYVHAGVAFFGGGKNYGVFENMNNSFESVVNYTVSLDDVDQSLLKAAAGDEPFYFMIYDQTSKFSPQKQQEMLNSDDAYSCIYNK